MKDAHQPVRSAEPFDAILARRLSRREVLQGGAGAAGLTLVSGLGLVACGGNAAAIPGQSTPALGFTAVGKGLADRVVVPAGYRAEVLYAVGDPIKAGIAAYLNDGTDGDMDWRAGDHHDGMAYFGLDADGDWDRAASARGLIAINHENLNQYYLHPNGPTYSPALNPASVDRDTDRPVADEVRKELHAHGVAVVEVNRTGGTWVVVQDSPFNRRVTPYTPIDLHGPARGSDLLKTAYDPEGLRTRGTFNNCAHGHTPWGTYLTCEENWAFYFRKTSNTGLSAAQVASNTRYGVAEYSGSERKFWANASSGTGDEFTRFNANALGAGPADDFRQEPNCFGWVVEIDPFDPTSTPRKRTALGRFAHEGCWLAPPVAGRPAVFYMGDDNRNDYIYKFVSDEPYDPADRGFAAGDKYLDNGTLYAARFHDDGTGEWLELSHNVNGLNATNPKYPFANQAAVLVNTRLAADAVGATRMDRPEWGAVNPANGEVYMALTNNSNRRPLGTTLSGAQLLPDAANPRAYEDPKGATAQRGNVNGHILRWREDGSQDAVAFRWDVFLFGAQADAAAAAVNLSGLTEANDFSSPDGLWFDERGVLWIQTDDGAYTDVTNCMMLAALPGVVGDGATVSVPSGSGTVATRAGRRPGATDLRRFLVGPKECEITGICMTPDGQTMFVNIQHPGEKIDDGQPGDVATPALFGSHWPLTADATADAAAGAGRPRSATIVITRDDGGVIGL